MMDARAPLAAFLLGAAIASCAAQASGKRTFATAESCKLAHWLTDQQCATAQHNALAELDEKTPRFSSRAECEKSFHHCMIAGFNQKRPEFQPSMRGFEITVRATGEPATLPIIDGQTPLPLQARPISHPSDASHARQAEAQSRWAKQQRERAAPSLARSEAPSQDQNLDFPAVAPTPPPPDPAAVERRRKEIRDAPTIY